MGSRSRRARHRHSQAFDRVIYDRLLPVHQPSKIMAVLNSRGRRKQFSFRSMDRDACCRIDYTLDLHGDERYGHRFGDLADA